MRVLLCHEYACFCVWYERALAVLNARALAVLNARALAVLNALVHVIAARQRVCVCVCRMFIGTIIVSR